MVRKGKAQATRPIPDWATLRPPVTETLLADITRRIVEKFQPYKVILFGSYAYGTPDLDSDVDLLVVMDSDEPMAQRIRRVTEVAKVRFLPMDIIVRTPAELAERLAMGDFFLQVRRAAALGPEGHLHAVPELVVEVLSPGGANERRDREAKLKLYSRRGVLEYWIVDWHTQQIEVYQREQLALRLVATLHPTDTLTSPLLPGVHVSGRNVVLDSIHAVQRAKLRQL